MTVTAGSVIDEDALAELLELDRLSSGGVFERVVRIYLERTPAILRDLERGIHERDAERVFAAAHSLKSSSLNVGAKTLSATCKDLEALGRSGTTAGAPALLAQINLLYRAVASELQGRIRSRGSSTLLSKSNGTASA